MTRSVAVLLFVATLFGCSSKSAAPPPPAPCMAGSGDAGGGDTGVDGGGPSLESLTVTGPAGSSIQLVPAFSPDVHDYYVQCAAGANPLAVSVKSPAGATSTLALETPGGDVKPMGSPAFAPAASMSVQEGQAIVATVAAGKATQEYWVRCLPADFPAMQWTENTQGCERSAGYYLLGNQWTTVAKDVGYAMVLDFNGVPVWYYQVPGAGVWDVESLAPGSISFLPYKPSIPFQVVTLSPYAIQAAGASSPDLDPHELRLLSDGGYVVMTYPIENGLDLSGLTVPGGPSLGSSESVASCVIVETDANGKTVWTWDITDHFDAKDSCTYPQAGAATWHSPDGGPAYDVFHCNSIDVDPANGNYLVSARNLDSVFYVEHATGKVLWKMGGTSSSKDNAPFLSLDDPFYRQHDARLLPGWSTSCGGKGQVSVFDDETATTSPARAVLYDVNVGVSTGSESCSAQASVAWQYAGTASSEYMGSFRIAADGDRVIDWGTGAKPGRVFTEVDPAGHDLLDFYLPPGGSSYRTIKAPLSALDLGALRSASGKSM